MAHGRDRGTARESCRADVTAAHLVVDVVRDADSREVSNAGGCVMHLADCPCIEIDSVCMLRVRAQACDDPTGDVRAPPLVLYEVSRRASAHGAFARWIQGRVRPAARVWRLRVLCGDPPEI